jgi:uncharacterized protein (DUF2384 family)
VVALANATLDKGVTLSAAVARIAEFWNLSNSKLGTILGLSAPTISRMKRGEATLDPASKSFEAGQFLVRLFRSLDAMLGSDDAAARRWLDTQNLDLDAKPIDEIDTMRGLIAVCDYVDFYRARV